MTSCAAAATPTRSGGGDDADVLYGDNGDDNLWCGYYDDDDYAYGGLGDDSFDDCEDAYG